MKGFAGIINPGKITNYVSCRYCFTDFNKKKGTVLKTKRKDKKVIFVISKEVLHQKYYLV